MRPRTFAADGKQFLAALRQRFANFLFAFLKMLSGIRNRVAFDQNIFAAEFIVRIASLRRVAVRLHTVMEIENLSGILQRIVDLFFCPDVEGAFGCLAVATDSPIPATTGLSASSAEKKPPSFEVMSRAT